MTAVSQLSEPLYDKRTGLASRALFRDRVEHALAGSPRRESRVALVLLEVDEGRRASAEVAREVARVVRPEDTVAVLESNYIGVLVEQVPGAAAAQCIRRRIEKIPACRASTLALSDARGRIGYWVGSSTSEARQV